MGFLTQLRLLLWKNYTIKKRRPWVLVFELFIPLVLFVILLAIRKKLPHVEQKASHHTVRALPSAGIVSILQAFCDNHDGVKDEQGFINYPNSTVTEFLEEFDIVAHNNNFFEPNFTPEDMDQLPDLYKSILEDPAAVHHNFQNARDFRLEDIFTDTKDLHDALVHNFTLTDSEVDTLFNSTVNVTEVYYLIFGSSPPDAAASDNNNQAGTRRQRRSAQAPLSSAHPHHSAQRNFLLPFDDKDTLQHLLHRDNGNKDNIKYTDEAYLQLYHDTLNSTSMQLALFNTTKVAALLNQSQSSSSSSSSSDQQDVPHGDNYDKFKQLLNNSDFQRISQAVLKMPPSQRRMITRALMNNPDLLMDPETRLAILVLLGGDESDDVQPVQVIEMLKVIVFDPHNMYELVCVEQQLPLLLTPAPNATANMTEIQHSLCNMTTAQWQAMSQLLLNHTNATQITVQFGMNNWNATVAHDRITTFLVNFHEYIVFQNNLDHLSMFAMTLPHDSCSDPLITHNTNATNVLAGRGLLGNNTQYTTISPDELETEESPIHNEKSDHDSEKKHKDHHAGLLRIWVAIQSSVCGKPVTKDHNTTTPDAIKDDTNIKDLGLTKKQQYDLKLLLHVLYSNPKVLFSPNGTEADHIIRKANETFELVDTVSVYARKWMNVSQSLREYLIKNTTAENIKFVQQMTLDIRQNPNLVTLLSAKDPVIGKFLRNGTLHDQDEFLAQLDLIDNAACSFLSLVKGINLNVFQGFNTEEDVVKYFLHNAYKDNVTVLASVIFTNMNEDGTLPPHIVYKIRQNTSFTHDTRRVRPPYWFPGPNSWAYHYYNFGFVWIQDVIERAIVDLFAGRAVLEPGSYLMQFPYPCYIQDRFLFMIEHVMPLCLTFSWVYTVAMLVRNIVYEKEQRLKEVMKIMGLSNSVHWIAWFITTIVQMTINMISLTCMLRWGNILPNSNPWIIFLLLEMFAIATISFSFLVSSLYSKAKLASAFAGILYFLTYVPYMYIAIREDAAFDTIPAWAKTIASLFSTTAFGLGSKYFANYEIEDVGVQWSNIYISPVENDQYNLFLVLLMMGVDSVLYLVLTWYIENIHPGSYGLPKPWYFPFTTTYWCGQSYKNDQPTCSRSTWRLLLRKTGLSITEEDQACAMEHVHVDDSNFEADPTNLPLGVSIENLTKKYKTGKVAVNRLNLKLYQDQITSFLGHNGAGKTTTMSILTGLFPPTSGYAKIYGKDIRTDMEDIRQQLGMCPQHNVLFDSLTVEEHLWFYACLKGCPKERLQQQINTMIEDTALEAKRHSLVDSLSGGMKRKLSVAIAFVSGSRTVILDEPTAGVDPYARRAIWDLLLKYKQGRTILLSTHHMDEADLLGDRIAIVSNGQVKCCGSSLFLKNTFGEGYHLTIVKKQSEEDLKSVETLSMDEFNPNSITISFHTQCCISNVTKFITHHVKSAYIKSFTNQEIHYILPFPEVQHGRFEALFSALESHKEELEISSYGVVDTNLEEVFLKITEQHIYVTDEDKEHKEDQRLIENLTAPTNPCSVSLTNDLNAANSASANDDEQLLLDHAGPVDTNATDANLLLVDGYSQQAAKSHDGHSGQGAAAIPKANKLPKLSGTTAFRLREFTRGHNRTPSDMSIGSFDGYTDLMTPQSPTRYANHPPPPSTQPQQHHSPPSGESRPEGYTRIPTEDEHNGSTSPSSVVSAATEAPGDVIRDGRSSHKIQGYTLILQQFTAIIIKRFVYIRRNWKGLFSQIILPTVFVCIAMTVALTAPRVEDFPPLILGPSQFFNHTQPRGNYIPYANMENHSKPTNSWSLDAKPIDILHTFKLPSGVGATCVLRSPFNSSFDEDLLRHLNFTYQNFNLLAKYFEPRCESVFRHGIPLDNFVPPVPTPPPPTLPHIDANSSNTIRATTPLPNHHPHTPRYYPSCQCSEHSRGFVCDDNYQDPPNFRAVTSDILQDISLTDSEDSFYLYTTDIYRLHRYGAFTAGNVRDYVPVNFGRDAPELFRKIAVRNAAKVWYNHKGYHTMPSYLNAWNNAILRANLNQTRGNPAAYGITLINHPMNNTNEINVMSYIYQGSDVLIAMFIIIAMSFVPASFVLFLVHERAIKAKHLQFVSGVNPIIYWLANFVWDMCNYLVPAACCILILRIFNIPAYCSATNTPAVVALFMLYGWSMTPLMYPASFFFNEPSTAYIFFIVVNLFTGITCILTSFLLEIFRFNDKDLAHTHELLKTIFLVFPNYCLGRGLMDIAFNEYQNQYYFKTGLYDKMTSPFEWKITSRNLVSMAAIGFIFVIITLLCEYNFFYKKKKISSNSMATPRNEDMDVASERRRVLRGSGKRDLIRIENLTQIYRTRLMGRHLAVDRLSVGIPQGECFGLLGINGAGKTTTFKMLTGDLAPSGGDAHLSGYSINKDINKIRQSIGYCPQFDALYDELTAREHLYLYCRLRGIPYNEQSKVVEWAIRELGITQYADKLSGTYSGGNKRKLSTAIALIGHPPVIFLDEPTTGMDPHSRRFLWDLILGLTKEGRSIILTSHSMEECEVLCSRLAIMVNGHFKCLGSIQHLKDRFGDGYTLLIRVHGPNYPREMSRVTNFVQRHFPLASLKDSHHNMLKFELPTESLSLSHLFARMEQAQNDSGLKVADYSISQNNLDNVFINFVKQQMEINPHTDISASPHSGSSRRCGAGDISRLQHQHAAADLQDLEATNTELHNIGTGLNLVMRSEDDLGDDGDDVPLLNDHTRTTRRLRHIDDDDDDDYIL